MTPRPPRPKPHRSLARFTGLALTALWIAASPSPLCAQIALEPWAHEVLQRNNAPWASLRFNADSSGSFALVEDAPQLSAQFLRDDPTYEERAYAARFDGSSSYIVLEDTAQAGELTALSVAAWIKPENTRPRSLAEQGYIVSKNSGAHNGFSLTTSYNDGLSATLVTDRGRFTARARNILTQGEWQLVGFSWDGKELTLLHNGRRVGETVATEGAYLDYFRPVTIGRAADRNALYYKGSIAEVVLLKKAFTIGDGGSALRTLTEEATQAPAVANASRRPRSFTQEAQAPLAVADFQDLSGWTLTHYPDAAQAQLERSQERALWGDFTAKVSFRNGSRSDPSLRKLVLTPPAPLTIDKPFDAFNLWVYGNFWGQRSGVSVSVQWRDSEGRRHDTSLQSHEFPYVFWRGWSVLHKQLAQPQSAPAQVLSLTISDFDSPSSQSVYFGPLYTGELPQQPLAGEFPSWEELGVATGPDAIVPRPLAGEGTNNVRKDGAGWLFEYRPYSGETLHYRYTPHSGLLSDITLSLPGRELSVANGGGWELQWNGQTYAPDAPEVSRRLLSCEQEGEWIVSHWQWQIGDITFPVSLRIGIRQQSLVVEAEADTTAVSALRLGAIAGDPQAKAVKVPYLVLRGRLQKSVDPSILSSGDWMVSQFIDWTYSNASELFGADGSNAHGILINGGSAYFPKTDGLRNTPRERIVISASQRFADVLPNIPNPPNRWLDETKDAIWATRMWYPNKAEAATYFDRELAYWKKMRAYGATDIWVRLHNNIYRTYIDYSGEPFALTSATDPTIGGDAALAAFSEQMRGALGYRLGIITNYTVASPVAFGQWNEDLLALATDGNWRYGSGSAHALKPSRMLEIQRQYTAELRDKYGFNIGYTDQITCRPPWALLDYDARTPQAGKFAPVIRAFAASLLAESDILNAPVFSEGIMQWLYAGFSDSYSQPGNYQEANLLVDFQHLRINPLSNDCGFSIAAMRRGSDCHFLLASQLVYGNIGHLADAYNGAPPAAGPSRDTLKSYFMMRFIQPLYANEPVERIAYHHDGELLSTEAAIRAGTLANRQVMLRYRNGTEVWVNRNPDTSWEPLVRGQRLLLPSNGFYAANADGSVVSYSRQIEGRRVDFASNTETVYCDGNGSVHDFGPIKAAQAYLLRRDDSAAALELIPAPFAKGESVTVRTDGTPLEKSTRALLSHLDAEGNILSSKTIVRGADGFTVTTTRDTFKYRITPL